MRTLKVLLFLFVIFIAACLLLLKITYEYTDVSPTGHYKVHVFKEPLFFAMPGGGSDHSAIVVLADKGGKILGTNVKCKAMFNSLDIQWDVDPRFVYYVRGQGFTLSTGVACE